MANLGLILLAFAFVFACIAARGWHFGWLSIACYIAAELFGGVMKAFH